MPRSRKKEEQPAKAPNEQQETIGDIEKRYGKGTIQMGGNIRQPDRISTGCFMLDFSLLGGIPVSKISTFHGEKHGGKTTMAYRTIAAAQAMYEDMNPVFVDLENGFNGPWAEAQGVDLDRLPVAHCETGEMAVDVAVALTESRETSLVVVDSLAALNPTKEMEESAEDAQVALQSRLITKMLRKLNHAMICERKRNHPVTVLFINQFRMKIGVSFGDPRTTPGGKASEHYPSVIAILKNKEMAGRDAAGIETMTHNEHSYTITKNKINNGPRTGEFRLIRTYDEANDLEAGRIDEAATMLTYAKKMGFYTGGGSSWTLKVWDSEYKFGKAAEAIAALNENRDLHWSLRNQLIREQAKSLGMPADFLELFEP